MNPLAMTTRICFPFVRYTLNIPYPDADVEVEIPRLLRKTGASGKAPQENGSSNDSSTSFEVNPSPQTANLPGQIPYPRPQPTPLLYIVDTLSVHLNILPSAIHSSVVWLRLPSSLLTMCPALRCVSSFSHVP